jgi:tetratricopeptide (TPR) repeat protein
MTAAAREPDATLYSGIAVERHSTAMPPRRAFVGRHRELDEVAGAFGDALAGRGGLFLLVGGAGIGKTRLADELTRLAEQRGLQPFWGRCWETGGAPAYWPWIQILREVARDRPADELRSAAGSGADAIAPLVPELAAAGGAAPAPEPDPSHARFRLFDAVTAVLRAAGRSRPLLLVLDDLHTADPSSLALLHFLARNLRGLRALVVGTYRDEDARLMPELGQALGDIAREGTYLPLAPLTRAEMAEVLAGFTGQPAEAALLDSVQAATEGNPLFLDELLRLLLQRGELGPAGGSARSPAAPLPVPDTVREVIRRRLSRLAADTRELLGLAAVAGREVGLATLAALAATDGAAAVARLEPAVAAGLLFPVEPAGYRFSHVLVREAVYRDLPPARRAELHLGLASLLEARGGDALAEVAHHRLAALPAGDPAAAASAAQHAAERAMSMLAFEDAAVLLEQARTGLAATGQLDAERAFELQLMAGLGFMRAGQGDRGRALCAAAAAEARRLGDGERLARAALGYGAELMLAQNDATLIGLLEEALGALSAGATGARAQVMSRLAAARMPADDVGPPMALARDAVALARAHGADPETLRRVLYFAGSALADYGDPAEQAALNEELVSLARAAGDKVQMLRGQCRLVFDYLGLADVERSQRAIEAYTSLAQEFRQPRHLWPASMMRAMYATAQGRAEDARRLLDEARALAASDRDATTASVLAWHGLSQVVAFERADGADAALDEVVRTVRVPAYERFAQSIIDVSRAMLLARFSDDPDDLQRTLDVLPWQSPFLRFDYGVVAGLAEPVAVAKDARRARSVYETLRPYGHRIGSSGRSGFACYGPIDGFIGLMAGTMGAHDEAIDRLERAIGVADRMGLRPHAADARQWQARFLAARGGSGDVERARERLAEADVVARNLGLHRTAGRIERVRAELDDRAGARAASRATPRGPALRFTREGEYWTVSAPGGTARMKDSRGMQMLAELIAHPGREHHVLALMGSDGDAVDGGDAGELLDEDAIADYRERLRSLEDELAEAEGWADAGRAARARAERDAIAQELARGVGMGGRGRRAGAAAERARVNVQRRIRGAIRKLGDSLPDLATYLDRTVKTGTFCSYEPL